MAPYDVEVQVMFWSYVLPLVLVILSGVFLRGYFKSWYKIGYAALIDRFSVKYNKKLANRKEKLFNELGCQKVNLTVLEVGAGGGANFKYFPKGTNVICLDPNPYFQSYLIENSDQFPKVHLKEFIIGTAEDMSVIPNDSVDAVVCTLVLCSVSDLDLCLKEIKRVLRKGGKFLFMEHVRADPSSWLYMLQTLVSPIWRKIADGCHFTGTPWINIEKAGFSSVEVEHFTEKLSKINLIGSHIMGVANK